MSRVLVIEAAGNLWGSERALLDLLDTMNPSKVAVCCPPGRPICKEVQRRGIRVFPHFVYALHLKSRWSRLRAAIGVVRACAAFRPDVIYLNQSGSYRVVLLASILFRAAIVAHVRIFEDAVYLASQRPSPRRLRSIIAISATIERCIRRLGPLTAISISTVYDGYSPAVHGPDCERADRIACVGRLVPIKGQVLLIEAINRLVLRRPRIECLMVGVGEKMFTSQLMKQAAVAPAGSKIRWTGFVNDVVALLSGCSVLACPSQQEPLGRVIFEAWNAGAVPVVFTGSGGAAEIVKAADAGVVYERQDADCLTDALEQALCLAPAERARLIENGRAWMARNCDAKRYGTVISAILDRAAVEA